MKPLRSSGTAIFCHQRLARWLAGVIVWVSAGAPLAAREVTLTLLQTTDLHGRLENPIPESPKDSPFAGLFRIATLVDAVRSENSNVLLVDCGDTIQGTPPAHATQGRLIVAAMELMGYDAWVPGNHEFDWGLGTFQKLHDSTRIPILAANLLPPADRPHPLPRVRPYLIRETDGIRVALIGLTTPGMYNWFLPELLGHLRFRGSVEALEEILPKVRAENPDLIVLLAHQGHLPVDDHASEINAIARAFPEIDVIFGGHTHQTVEGRDVGEALYVQAGYHGHALARVDLVFDTEQRRIVRKIVRLLHVNEDVARHPRLVDALGIEWHRAIEALDQVVGHAAMPIPATGMPPGLTPLAMLMRQAFAEVAGAAVVFHNQFSSVDVTPGPIRERDLWRWIPYENFLVTARLTVEEMREIMEENAALWNSRAFMGTHGLDVALRPTAPVGQRVMHLDLAEGVTSDDNGRVLVAFNSYTAASGGQRHVRLREILRQPEAQMRILPIDMRDALREHVRRHSPISHLAASGRWTLLQETDAHPVTTAAP